MTDIVRTDIHDGVNVPIDPPRKTGLQGQSLENAAFMHAMAFKVCILIRLKHEYYVILP